MTYLLTTLTAALVIDVPMTMTKETILQRHPDALTATIGDLVLLLSIDRGQYYALDAIGSDIWQRIEQPTSLGDLCTSLLRDYDGDGASIEHGVVALLEQLAGQNLLEMVTVPSIGSTSPS